VTSEALTAPNSLVRQDTQQLESSSQKSFAESALLLDEKFEQNSEGNCRKSVWSTKVGEANVRSYGDIVKAQAKRDAKEAAAQERKRGAKRKCG
jgi:hypothetical protein